MVGIIGRRAFVVIPWWSGLQCRGMTMRIEQIAERLISTDPSLAEIPRDVLIASIRRNLGLQSGLPPDWIVGSNVDVVYVDPSAEGGFSSLSTLPSVYALVPFDQVIPSHVPEMLGPFRERPEYPRELQERDYTRDDFEKAKVVRQSTTLRPDMLINTNPDAVNGPPIIDKRGFVLGGNSRAMAIELSRRDSDVYENGLAQGLADCNAFGLSFVPGTMLVRVLLGDYDRDRISRLLNRSATQVLGLAAQAVSLGRMLPAELFQDMGRWMAEQDASSFNDILSDHSAEILDLLTEAKIVTPQTRTTYESVRKGSPTGKLSSGGRQKIRMAFLGALVGDKEILALASPRQEKVFERIAPVVLGLQAEEDVDDQYKILGDVQAAIDFLASSGITSGDAFRLKVGTLDVLSGDDADDPALRYPQVYNDPATAVWTRWLANIQTKPLVAFREIRAYSAAVPRGRSDQGLGFFAVEDVPPASIRGRTLDFPWAGDMPTDIPAWFRGE